MGYPKGAPHPKLVGDRTQAHVLARLLEIYERIWLPFGENNRADLVIENGDRFIRVQCKTGRFVKGAVVFNACSSTYHHPNREAWAYSKQSYRGQIDYFAVYCRATNGVYLVPVEEVGNVAASLRVEPTRNAQRKGIRWARDYEVRGVAGAAAPSDGRATSGTIPLWPA